MRYSSYSFCNSGAEWRTAVEFAGLVLACEELPDRPLILDVRFIRLIDDLLHHVRRDEEDALAVAEHYIARHHDRFADLDGYVDPDHADLCHKRWMRLLVVHLCRQIEDALQVANVAIDYRASAGPPVDGGVQVVASERVSRSGAHQIDHRNIAALQNVDDLLVRLLRHVLRTGIRVEHGRKIGTRRKELRRHCSADQLLSGMQNLEVPACELMLVAFVLEDSPGFLERQSFDAFEDGIVHLRTPVGRSGIGIQRRVLRHLLRSEPEYLSGRGQNKYSGESNQFAEQHPYIESRRDCPRHPANSMRR